jgi:hypothetical protein
MILHGAWEYDGFGGCTMKGTWPGRIQLTEDNEGYVGLIVKEYRTWSVSQDHPQQRLLLLDAQC